MQFPITIGLRRSRLLSLVLHLVGLLAAAAILAFPAWFPLKGLLLLALAISMGLARSGLSPGIHALRLTREGAVSVCASAGGDFLSARLLSGACVHPWLSVLPLALEDGRRHTLLIASDSLSADDFRRLRVFLRWRLDLSGADDDV